MREVTLSQITVGLDPYIIIQHNEDSNEVTVDGGACNLDEMIQLSKEGTRALKKQRRAQRKLQKLSS
jgi:hypothetical protein